jgi:hypothetical protein
MTGIDPLLVPFIEIILDASQIDEFEECALAWYLGYHLNLEPRHSKHFFNKGSYIHEVLAHYYSNPLNLPDWEFRVKDALEFARTVDLFKKWGIKTQEEKKFYFERLREYFYRWWSEDIVTEVIAVEKGFSWLLYEDERRRYILEGKIDLVARTPNLGLIVQDHKSQSRAYEKYELNHQVMNYFSYVKPDYFVYNYIGLQDKKNDSTFVKQIYKPHPGMLEQWRRDVLKTFHSMYDMITAHAFDEEGECKVCGDSYDARVQMSCASETSKGLYHIDKFPRRRANCASKFGLCQFHHICEVPDNSKWVPIVKNAYKLKDEKWRAWT